MQDGIAEIVLEIQQSRQLHHVYEFHDVFETRPVVTQSHVEEPKKKTKD